MIRERGEMRAERQRWRKRSQGGSGEKGGESLVSGRIERQVG